MALLQQRPLPENIRLVDVGTTIYHTMGILAETRKLIVFDAVKLDGAPGTVYKFNADEFRTRLPRKATSHEIGILDALALLRLSGQNLPEVVIVGVQPKEYGSWGDTLSPEVERALPEMVDMAVEQLKSWKAIPAG